MDPARDRILEAVEKQQITAREAARLLDALAGKREPGPPALRLRLTELASGRRQLDLLLPLAALEAAAKLNLQLDALWGLGTAISAQSVLEALRGGAVGVLAQAEADGKLLEVLAEAV